MASSASFYIWNGLLSKGIACKCLIFVFMFVIVLIRYCFSQYIRRWAPPFRIKRAVYRDLHDLVPRVNLPILTSIAVCHRHQCFWWAIYPQRNTVDIVWNMPKYCVFVEWAHIVYLYTSFAEGWWNVLELSAQCTLYFCVFASQICSVTDYFIERLLPYSSALQLWKLPQIQTFILPDFSHHLSKIVIIRFLCFSLLRNKLDYEQITT